MADPRPHTPGSDADADVDRDSKIEHLLLAGLDHYFAGDHERAIGVWTRVLFLDRGHARARAYIERARSAMSERLRETEELIHRGTMAFDRGETEEARRLLTSAVERGGPQEVALAFLERIERLGAPDTEVDRPVPGASPPRRRRTSRRLRAPVMKVRWGVPLLIAASLIAAISYALLTWPDLPNWTGRRADPRSERARDDGADAAGLPVLAPGELAIARATTLASQGRVRDALRLLDQVPPADAARPEVDRLRANLQRALLGADTAAIPPPVPERSGPQL